LERFPFPPAKKIAAGAARPSSVKTIRRKERREVKQKKFVLKGASIHESDFYRGRQGFRQKGD
jgi:hypothetical protein